ncbi:HDL054Wp [Eremothecium sinecaudum]|uniref:Required for respiratory growth protein 8, mitochondrial n=1 Tax=Eremothecium sinecaudum TaxID=45286 RepID=A0A0X8HSM1_9SACH|nr:HDL054Wp [Eremothecium sinecaudum]AMD20690.1 HDL054Wp [Eremothecium sinecaudum]
MSTPRPQLKDIIVKCVGRKELAPRRSVKPKMLVTESPLVKDFHKWSGKQRRLFYSQEDVDHDPRLGLMTNWNLTSNFFAGLLKSPIRLDKHSRAKVPRDLLIKLKMEELPPNEEGKLIKITPTFSDAKSLQSSYVSASSQVLENIFFRVLLPKSINGSAMRYYDKKEILSDKAALVDEFRESSLKLITEGLTALLNDQQSAAYKDLEDWDILVTYDTSNPNDIEIRKCQNLKNKPTIIMFNLKVLENKDLEDMFSSRVKNPHGGIVLKLLKNKILLNCMYKLIAFSSN